MAIKVNQLCRLALINSRFTHMKTLSLDSPLLNLYRVSFRRCFLRTQREEKSCMWPDEEEKIVHGDLKVGCHGPRVRASH